MSNTVTFTPEALQKVMAEAVAQALAQWEKTNRTIDMDSACVRAFKKGGYGEVKPRIDVMSYHLWVAAGFKVKAGERSVRVRNLQLFHRSQVEPISKQEQAQYLAERDARKTNDKLPTVSPITEAPRAQAKKAKPLPTSEQPSPSPSA